MNYTEINDPGHGWIGVPLSELVELGIADKVTSFSYQDGNLIWLEEDCDMSTWLHALAEKQGSDPAAVYRDMIDSRSITSHNVEQTYIRDLPAFNYAGGAQCI